MNNQYLYAWGGDGPEAQDELDCDKRNKTIKLIFYIILMSVLLSNCTPAKKDYAAGSFGYDLNFFKQHDSVIVLSNGDAQVIVSAKYQGKVFTSSANGAEGKSFGWINYKSFDAPLDQHMNAYGGENRFWLGPEGGKYSMFFPKDSAQEFAHWKTPAAYDSEAWDVVSSNDTATELKKEMKLQNYKGSTFDLRVNRKIKLLSKAAMENLLQVSTGNVNWVGYRTENMVTNTGNAAWDSVSGMPCIWMLDMFPPSDSTTIVIPYKEGNNLPANTEYFGVIPTDRIKYANNVLFFKADGKQRGKLGIHPDRVLPVAGSYDAANHVLTIALFDVNPLGQYLNQEWGTIKPLFSGDAMNAYNDGPLEGGGQLGPFYEIESVSTALALPAGQSATHWHSVFHFTGDEQSLDVIAKKVLGVSIATIKSTF